MTQVKKGRCWLTVIGLYMALVISGCTSAQPQLARMTCLEAKQDNYTTVTDLHLNRLLDESVNDADLYECWQPAIKAALQQDRRIEKRHLIKAVERFNQRCEEVDFHRAVSQYFALITPHEYRGEDRQLLAAYARFLINQATRSTDVHLKEVKLLCARLDDELYNKFFE